MKPFHSWSSAVTILTLALCAGVALAAPNVRVKRGDEVEVIADAESAVNPLASQLWRPQSMGFEGDSAVIGSLACVTYVFGAVSVWVETDSALIGCGWPLVHYGRIEFFGCVPLNAL
uniref:Uncharacterized protein n=1 Tax=Anopheles coluzzii TaxID=1518534 RepID=A0A8W7NZJ9_ANOCL